MRFSALAALPLAVLLAAPVRAHFLWVEIKKSPAPTVVYHFSETPGEATAANLTARVKPTPVTLTDSSHLAAADQTWGVLDRTAQNGGLFLLIYHAKAAASLDDAQKMTNQPLEITVTKSGSPCRATVTRNGKATKNAEIVIERPGGGTPQTAITDESGAFQFDLKGDGLYGLRAMAEEKTAGTYEGKAYPSVRHYATLTFTVGSDAKPTTADPEAYKLLEGAHDNRQTMGDNFAGMTADITFNDNGKESVGTVSYTKADSVTLKMDGLTPEAKGWLEGQLSNALGHRRGGKFSDGDGKNPLTFTPDDRSPLGRQIALNDGLTSLYRVKDNVVTEVTRTMGGQKFTITVLDTQKTDGGKYLPHDFVVTYFDAKTGDLKSVEAFTDAHAQIGGVWVPTSRRVVTGENGTLTTRQFTLSNVKLAEK